MFDIKREGLEGGAFGAKNLVAKYQNAAIRMIPDRDLNIPPPPPWFCPDEACGGGTSASVCAIEILGISIPDRSTIPKGKVN